MDLFDLKTHLRSQDLQLDSHESAQEIVEAGIKLVYKHSADFNISLAFSPSRVKNDFKKKFGPAGEAFSALFFGLKDLGIRTDQSTLSISKTGGLQEHPGENFEGKERYAFVRYLD